MLQSKLAFLFFSRLSSFGNFPHFFSASLVKQEGKLRKKLFDNNGPDPKRCAGCKRPCQRRFRYARRVRSIARRVGLSISGMPSGMRGRIEGTPQVAFPERLLAEGRLCPRSFGIWSKWS